MDGLEIQWPTNAGQFPTGIEFRYQGMVGPGATVDSPQIVSQYSYGLIHSWSHGPLLADGMRAAESALFAFNNRPTYTALPSVREMFQDTEAAPESTRQGLTDVDWDQILPSDDPE